MCRRTSRRTFLKQMGLASVSLPLVGSSSNAARPPSERLRIASIGVGGKGWVDSRLAASDGHELVAFCDVVTAKDNHNSGGYVAAAKRWPEARRYQDWRRMLDECRDIDAVTISTPDHMHAAPTLAAMRLGKHVFTQKPLTHTVHEARVLASEAKKLGVKTQMGIQNQSRSGHRSAVQLVKQGVIGKIKEVHCWSYKEWGGPPERRPDHSDPVPAGLDWDLWLGVAPERPYVHRIYQPKQWRKWIDFGSGTLGDMGIHIFEPTFSALGFKAPLSVVSEGSAPYEETWRRRNTLRYTFAGNEHTAGDRLDLTWRDGRDCRPPQSASEHLPEDAKLPSQGTLFVGTKGALVHKHIGGPTLYPEELRKSTEVPRLEHRNHYGSWRQAIVDGGEACASFGFSGPLTETVLLGCVAVRFPGERLEWEPEGLRIPNRREAEKYLRTEYRDGWKLDGLS